ncbi:hypothetical protein R1sor_012251 [Riccia sorocarpa]|uniref:Uncharacterized protein n=1 Tax=Riccia sorocarpa TaxID=122646 RepID=A0ABD3I391_9MARC
MRIPEAHTVDRILQGLYKMKKFLGSIGAEDAAGSWLDKLLHLVFDNSPVKEFAELVCQEVPNEHVQTTVAELAKTNYSGEDAQVMHEGIEQLFRIPHAFSELPVVQSVEYINQLPQQAVMAVLEVHKVEPTGEALVLQGLQRWSECDGLVQVASQVVVGGATEVSLQIVAEKGAEGLVECLTTGEALVLQGLQRWSECDGLVQVASQVVVGGATEVSLQIVAEKGAEKLVEGLTTPQDSAAQLSEVVRVRPERVSLVMFRFGGKTRL